MAVPFLLCGVGLLFAMCAACFYRMGASDCVDEKKFLIDSLEFLASENAKLRELCADLYAEMLTYSIAPNYNASVWAVKLRELGVEVD